MHIFRKTLQPSIPPGLRSHSDFQRPTETPRTAETDHVDVLGGQLRAAQESELPVYHDISPQLREYRPNGKFGYDFKGMARYVCHKIMPPIQYVMMTTEPTKQTAHKKSEDFYFKSAEEIASFREQPRCRQFHLNNFQSLCEFFGIEVEVQIHGDNPIQLFFRVANENIFGLKKEKDKDVFVLFSRMIASLSLIHGYQAGLSFSKFLCTTILKREQLSELTAEANQARKYWVKEWAPKIQRRPCIEKLAALAPKAGAKAIFEVQPLIDLSSDFEAVEDISRKAQENLTKWNRAAKKAAAEATAEATEIPSDTAVLVHPFDAFPNKAIHQTKVSLVPMTSVGALNHFSKELGVEFALLNFANAYRVGGGVLGAGRVQEEGLFQRTTMFAKIPHEIDRGEVIFRPEKRVAETWAERTHEGQYPQQLEYTEKRTSEIKGRAEGNPYILDLSGVDLDDPEIRNAYLNDVLRSVVIRDNLGSDLSKEEYTPFLELRAALEDRNPGANPNSMTEAERRASPAFNRALIRQDLNNYTHVEHTEVTQTLRSVLLTAKKLGLKNLMLGAIGCGAFKHKPEVIAQIWNALLTDDEFKNAFDFVIFAIPDETSINYTVFQQVLFPS